MNIDSQLLTQFLDSSGVSTDTRKITEGNMFFALKGDKFDANNFVDQAIQAGAKYVVIDNPEKQVDGKTILVDDVLIELQRLALTYRNTFKIPVIGITGSNGKTTTKELLAQVLSKKFKVHFTKGNLNNHIGVPLTLLDMPKDTEIAIIEMGANKVGDIHELCTIANPNFGVITNIGNAHLEGFGGPEGVLKAKTELYQYLILNRGTVFINATDNVLHNMAKRFEHPILYGTSGSFSKLKMGNAKPYLSFIYQNTEYTTQLIGDYNFSNIETAFCIGKYFEVNDLDQIEAICEYAPTNNRSEFRKVGSNQVILDAYNANPTSVKAALKNLMDLEAQHKVTILADMNELGIYADEQHNEIISVCKSIPNAKNYFIGKNFYKFKSDQENYFLTKEDFTKHIENHPIKASLVLIKGSRSNQLETILEHLKS